MAHNAHGHRRRNKVKSFFSHLFGGGRHNHHDGQANGGGAAAPQPAPPVVPQRNYPGAGAAPRPMAPPPVQQRNYPGAGAVPPPPAPLRSYNIDDNQMPPVYVNPYRREKTIQEGMPLARPWGGLNRDALSQVHAAAPAALQRSNGVYDSVKRGQGEIGNVYLSLGFRMSKDNMAKAALAYQGTSFEGLDQMYASYVRKMKYNQHRAPGSGQARLNRINSQRQNIDGRDMDPIDDDTLGITRDGMQIFFDYLGASSDAREYLYNIANEIKDADIFGGDMRKALNYTVSNENLKYNLSTVGSRMPELDGILKERGGNEAPEQILLRYSHKAMQQVANGYGAGKAIDMTRGYDPLINLREYYAERMEEIAASMGLGQQPMGMM